MNLVVPPALEDKFKTCQTLPSPPTFALQVIDLLNDPEVEIEQAARVFSTDPAFMSKILRIANSPLYAHQRQVETLHMAILVLGLNATCTLALSFSLVEGLRQDDQERSLNYLLYWKRTGLAAAASRVLGKYCKVRDLEELFIAALLQDIGMLALDRICPELYAAPDLNQLDHGRVVAHEQQHLGVHHATAGSWLLAQWNLPERLPVAVAYSENPLNFSPDDDQTTFVRCVAGSGILANLLLNGATEHAIQDTEQKLEMWLGLPGDRLGDILEELQPSIVEVENLFDMNISAEVNPTDLIERARELQLIRNIQVCQEVEKLKEDTMNLESQYDHIQHHAQRDGLTQVFNRGFLDEYLETMFQASLRKGTPISVGFVDLDHFKHVNDTYGHQVGDQILKTVAVLLQSQVRRSDIVGRYGGEEFLVLLPETPSAGAKEVFERLMEAFRSTRHDIAGGQSIVVTASIGVATHSQEWPFQNVRALVQAADQALYKAKAIGRNVTVKHENLASICLVPN